MRRKHGFAITVWVFLPDHWHAIIYPPYPLTISTVFRAVKVSSMIGINVRRRERGELWQDRFFDRAPRTVKEYNETVEYIHLNPVRRGLVGDTRDWKWSSVHEYAGVSGEESVSRRTVCVSTGCACQPMRTPASEGRTADLGKQVCARCHHRQPYWQQMNWSVISPPTYLNP